MSSEDDVAYRKSVRNMSVILAVIVITIFAAIFVPPYVNPPRDVFQPAVTYESFFGFVMHLDVNSTSVPPQDSVLLTGWVNSSFASIENVTASNSWAVDQGSLWEKTCTLGWPIGVGVMQGHYTQDNFTLGTLLPVTQPGASCPAQAGAPAYFLFEPYSSKALVTIGGNPAVWNIATSFSFRQPPSGGQLAPGVYTAVLADEWGDVLTTNFLVT
jgi:hypothetical protein